MVLAPKGKAVANAKASVSALKKKVVAELRQVFYTKAVNQLHAA